MGAREHRLEVITALLALATIVGLKLLSSALQNTPPGPSTSNETAASCPVMISRSQQLTSDPSSLSSNVLELPRASLGFVGDWGGYTHSDGSLMGVGPDRVSIIFGRRGDTVFLATELYSPSGQRIIGKPRVRILNPRASIIQYESEDDEVIYTYSHRFRLLDSGRIAYRQRVDLFDRKTRRYIGASSQHATLRRLFTADEERMFSQPASGDIHRGSVETTENFTPRPSRKAR
jgi:hypothetical protein